MSCRMDCKIILPSKRSRLDAEVSRLFASEDKQGKQYIIISV